MSQSFPIRSKFSAGSLSARACWISTAVLMLVSPIWALSFFLLVACSVMPLSMLRNSRSRFSRFATGLYLFAGYGVTIAAIFFEFRSHAEKGYDSISYSASGTVTLIGVIATGILFLPLSAFQSLSTLVQYQKNRSDDEDLPS